MQDTDEVMVAASDWLSTDKKQCYWPPFKSTEKYLEAVKNNLGPSTEEKPWEILNVIFHAEYGNTDCFKMISFHVMHTVARGLWFLLLINVLTIIVIPLETNLADKQMLYTT